MNDDGVNEISRHAAEQLMRGVSAGHPELAQLLSAAAAPGTAAETAGEHAALTAFRAVQVPLALPHSPGRLHMLKSTIAKVVLTKAAAATAAGLTVGGVALAAATGAIPSPLTSSHSGTSTSTVTTPTTTATTTTTTTTGDPTTAADARSSASATPSTSATPSPSMVGLCHAYTAAVAASPGKALTNPAFQALVSTAGGASSVPSYCTALLVATHPTGRPSALPSQANSHASDHPTGRPSSMPSQAASHPTGRPSSLPSQAASHPTGRPSSLPSQAASHPSGQPSSLPSQAASQPSSLPSQAASQPSSLPSQAATGTRGR